MRRLARIFCGELYFDISSGPSFFALRNYLLGLMRWPRPLNSTNRGRFVCASLFVARTISVTPMSRMAVGLFAAVQGIAPVVTPAAGSQKYVKMGTGFAPGNIAG